MDAGVLLPSFLTALVTLSAVNAEVCFWSGSCYNKWMGGCGTGRVMVDQSDDCNGLCPQPHFPACLPFFTHFQCCNEETPVPSDECARCPNRVEVGNHWMCCSDCTEAKVTNHEAQAGFCRSGAQLSIQPKSREVLRWRITRDWSVCSKRCGGGVRERSVRCVGSLEYSPQQLYYVNDTKCDQSKMPTRKEYCSTRPCHGGDHSRGISLHHKEHHKELLKEHLKEHYRKEHHRGHERRKGLPVWAIMLISVVTVSAVAGLALGAYAFYRRRQNENHGFVYVMLDSYN